MKNGQYQQQQFWKWTWVPYKYLSQKYSTAEMIFAKVIQLAEDLIVEDQYFSSNGLSLPDSINYKKGTKKNGVISKIYFLLKPLV